MTNEARANASNYPSSNELPMIEPVHARVGPYQLLCKLGSGGMGNVYVATRVMETQELRTVVVKTLRAEMLARPACVSMFLDEARIAARVLHPYVCSIIDVGHSDGVPYAAMEYLVGEPVSRVISTLRDARGETAVACAVKIVSDLCEGLHAAHELRDASGKLLGVVHRDISPDNLFVLYDGTVRVMDFGIANTADLRKSQNKTLAGKWGYMAPEQLRCEPIDRRSDLWAMGVVLWEFLTGRRLFQHASDVRCAVAVLSEPIAVPSTINPHVPKNLDAVVMRALSRDQNERYATAREMGQALEHVLYTSLKPVSAPRLGQWLSDLFPGRQDFWHRIVAHVREEVEHSGPVAIPREIRGGTDLEFDPLLKPQGSPDLKYVIISPPELPIRTTSAPELPAELAAPPSAQTAPARLGWFWPLLLLASVAGGVLLLRDAKPEPARVSETQPQTVQRAPSTGLAAPAANPTSAVGRKAPPKPSLVAAQPAVAAEPNAAPAASPATPATPDQHGTHKTKEPVAPSPAHDQQHARQAAPRVSEEGAERAPQIVERKGSVYFATTQPDMTVEVNGKEIAAPARLSLDVGDVEVVVRRHGQLQGRAKLTVVAGNTIFFSLDSER